MRFQSKATLDGFAIYFTACFKHSTRTSGRRFGRHLECAPRTLLVDANTVSANAISRYLTNWKVETAVVSTVDAAEIACRNAVATGRPFDVVILDVKGLAAVLNATGSQPVGPWHAARTPDRVRFATGRGFGHLIASRMTVFSGGAAVSRLDAAVNALASSDLRAERRLRRSAGSA